MTKEQSFTKELVHIESFCSIVVIMFASRAKRPGFETGQKHWYTSGAVAAQWLKQWVTD